MFNLFICLDSVYILNLLNQKMEMEEVLKVEFRVEPSAADLMQPLRLQIGDHPFPRIYGFAEENAPREFDEMSENPPASEGDNISEATRFFAMRMLKTRHFAK